MLTAYSFQFITVYDTLLDMVLIFHPTLTPLELVLQLYGLYVLSKNHNIYLQHLNTISLMSTTSFSNIVPNNALAFHLKLPTCGRVDMLLHFYKL